MVVILKVSALILTLNEEGNLPRCLEALAWCDDVVVLDSGSTDRTAEIALSYGARFITRPFDTFADQRNYGLERGSLIHEWVLHLDADEVVTTEFKVALDQLVPARNVFAFRVPSKLMLHDRWLRHAGMYPTYQVRIGHRERLRFKQIGHGQREDLPASAVATFEEPYLHYNFSHGIPAWFVKHVRYARDEGENIFSQRQRPQAGRLNSISLGRTGRRRMAKTLAGRLPLFLRPFLRFFYIMVICQGFREGRTGLTYATMLAVYEGMIAVFGYERMMTGPYSSTPEGLTVVEDSEASDVVR